MDGTIFEHKWYSQGPVDTLNILETSTKGLSTQDVIERRNIFGPNKLPESKRKNRIVLFFEQFNDILIFILLAGALISIILAIVEVDTYSDLTIEHFLDAIVIGIVLIFNALIGFYQEIKAEKEVSSLKSLITTESIVVRNNKKVKVHQDELVIGDIIILEAGQKVPADARLIEVTNIQVIESSLTGESLPVEKNANILLDSNSSLADRTNMLFMGTTVSFGKGMAVVTATGISTEVGKIANIISSIGSSKTPLQQRLEMFGKQLGIGTLILATIMIIFGFFSEYFSNSANIDILKTILDLTIIGVSLVVAAVPEGLPAVMVLVLALGIRRMAHQHAISKSLQAIESIGSTTFICTDKTGTLTLNKMAVTKFVTYQHEFLLDSIKKDNFSKDLEMLCKIGENANSAIIDVDEDTTNIQEIGDPLDIAILKSLEDFADKKFYFFQNNSKFSELPFDSNRKRMSAIVYENEESYVLYTKGAPDTLLDICRFYISENGNIADLNSIQKELLNEKIHSLSSQGLKVIGCGYKTLSKELAFITKSERYNFNEIESDLVFAGFFCLIDPPRPEVIDAISDCKTAGIDVMMITGDHPSTALAIGKQIHLINDDETKFLSGIMIDKLDDNALSQHLLDTRILARVSPEHKLRVVKLLQNKGQIVAMTGDGVNDAPALRQADIGVAMGRTGSEAASEASDLILTDDNFATLVDAIEEGRSIQTNIRKFIGYLLASNTGEVLLLLLSVLIIGLLAPTMVVELSPLNESQILYMNLVTDTFLAIAIGLEKKGSTIMMQPPMDPKEPIVTKKTFISITFTGIYVSGITLSTFLILLGDPSKWISLSHETISYAQTITMTLIIFLETFIALSYRSQESVINSKIISNKFFVVSFLIVFILQFIILFVPFFRLLFKLAEIKLLDLLIILLLSMIALILEEIRKKILYNQELFSNKIKIPG